MACREGLDPADFSPGSGDDSDDPIGSQLLVLDTTAQIVDAQGHVMLEFTIGVDNINFDNDITFNYDTSDGTALSSGANQKYTAVTGQSAKIPAGSASVVVAVPVWVSPPAGGAMYTGKAAMTLTISSPVNATILDATATGTIDYSLLASGINPVSTPGLTVYAPNPNVDEGDLVLIQVALSPASGGTVTVHYATADGTAIAGTDYENTFSNLTFTPGQTIQGFYVRTLSDPAAEGNETFTVNLSSPSGAAIATGSVTITILANAGSGLPAQYTGWDDNMRVTYDEFHAAGGGGCKWQTACTGFAGAAVMSALAANKGKGRWRFNAQKLYQDAGCPVCQSGGNCDTSVCGNGCNPSRVPGWLASNGAQRIDKSVVNAGSGQNFTCEYRDVTADHQMFKAQSTAISAGNKSGLINQIKQAIFDNGAMYMASIFYHNWNSCYAADGYVLRNHNSDTSDIAHVWTVIGWDDNHLIPANADPSFGSLRGQRVGCFRLQSSHGCDWGESGRGYIPYSYLTLPTKFSGTAVRYKYWKLTWVG